MKRIDIHYGGEIYSVGDRDLEELKAELAEGSLSGHHWLLVNDGEGQRRDAYLLIGAGPIALIPIPDETPAEPA